VTLAARSIEFTLPGDRVAQLPAEKRGQNRDRVRLMVAHRWSVQITHRTFRDLADVLGPGDALVVNVSATLPAAVDAETGDGERIRLHLAGPTGGGLWAVEVRRVTRGGGTSPGPHVEPQTLSLPGGVSITLLAPSPRSPRLWIAAIEGTPDVTEFLADNGKPIRYTPGPTVPIEDYQTVFATTPGSAEMPSAARPFTETLVTDLIARGVAVLPVTLHTGVSSYEERETPGEERYSVPQTTAASLNALRAAGGRIVAVGTTTVRALETVSDTTGVIHPGSGLTDLVVTPAGGVRSVDALITGWHEPRSSHLLLLEAIAGRELLGKVYKSALHEGYLWHEFGDSLLILP
jgi:S-adenosylmethionine:tRNA ribosyltransferase-isomerase